MSVVIPFPVSRTCASSERLRAIRSAVALRAKSTGASMTERQQAAIAATLAWDSGQSAGACIQAGYDLLPSVRGQR